MGQRQQNRVWAGPLTQHAIKGEKEGLLRLLDCTWVLLIYCMETK